MSAYNAIRGLLTHLLRDRPRVKRLAADVENRLVSYRNSVATVVPALIPARPNHLMIAVTASCNARCIGCRYGRDFMPGHQLSWEMTRDLLDDAGQCGFRTVRLYGGEPLLHPDLPKMVAHARHVGLRPYITTNALLLGKRIGDLHAAGLRDLSVGFYGVGSRYDEYVQRPGSFAKVEAGIAAVRERHGHDVKMQMNWLLMRPRCDLESLHAAFDFALKYDMNFQVDLIHYSLPYFSEGPDRSLQFRPGDRPAIEAVTSELLRLQAAHPVRVRHSPQAIRSMPDWLLLGPAMRVPCTANEMIWVGADGTVQMCYVTFRLGNLYERRLRDMLFTAEHRAAARDGFALRCPNCHCSANERILRHGPSRARYGRDRAAAVAPDVGRGDAPPPVVIEGLA